MLAASIWLAKIPAGRRLSLAALITLAPVTTLPIWAISIGIAASAPVVVASLKVAPVLGSI